MESTLATWAVPDLAKRYDVTEKTIYIWIHKKWLPPRCKMPGQTPFWYVHLIEKWEKDRGICKLSALYAQSEGISPCSRIDRITDVELADRYNIELSTVRRLATATPFPQPMERVPSTVPDEPETLIFNGDAVRAFEKEDGGHSVVLGVCQQDEVEFLADQRDGDAQWTADVDVQGDIA